MSNHEKLKDLAIGILKERGFAEDQIFTEVPILQHGQFFALSVGEAKHNLTIKKGIVVDVLGLKDDYCIAVECGTTPTDRLIQLKLFCDEVYYLPYVQTSEILTVTPTLEKEVMRLENENAGLRSQLELTTKRYHQIRGLVNEAYHVS